MTTRQIEIPLNKRRFILIFYVSIAYIVISLWFVIHPPIIQNKLFSRLILVAGIASILFFGLLAFVFLKKIKNKKTGLIIDKTGITEDVSGISAGHIPWSDIIEIKSSSVLRRNFMIFVSNPDDYINRQTSVGKRKYAERKYKNSGSPICFSVNLLKCKYDDLKNILQTEFDKNKSLRA